MNLSRCISNKVHLRTAPGLGRASWAWPLSSGRGRGRESESVPVVPFCSRLCSRSLQAAASYDGASVPGCSRSLCAFAEVEYPSPQITRAQKSDGPVGPQGSTPRLLTPPCPCMPPRQSAASCGNPAPARTKQTRSGAFWRVEFLGRLVGMPLSSAKGYPPRPLRGGAHRPAVGMASLAAQGIGRRSIGTALCCRSIGARSIGTRRQQPREASTWPRGQGLRVEGSRCPAAWRAASCSAISGQHPPAAAAPRRPGAACPGSRPRPA